MSAARLRDGEGSMPVAWAVRDKGSPRVVSRPRPSSLWESSYLPEVTRGVWVTLRHLLSNLLGRRTPRYPEQRRPLPPRHRGLHRLLSRDDGSARCTACQLCATVCPSQCIHVMAGEADDPRVGRVAEEFIIDELRCAMCGLCVEACPEDALRMDSQRFARAVATRREALMYRLDLLEVTGPSVSLPPLGPQDYRLRRHPRRG